jgi:hypothetical protein
MDAAARQRTRGRKLPIGAQVIPGDVRYEDLLDELSCG